MLKRALFLLVINVALFCALAEIAALGIFYVQHGWLFYLDPYRPVYEAIEQGRGTAGEGQLSDIGLAPYFGPIHRPGVPFDIPEALHAPGAAPPRHSTNNFGFVSAHDYPFTPGPNQFVLGIFGGSVAGWFCEVGADRLVADLRQQPFFASTEIVPLCFAHEGYKQPQQLLVLAYFLSIGQHFDLAVNIDGFNEVAIGSLNEQHGWDETMPSVLHLDPLLTLVNQSTLTPAKLESLTAITRDRDRLTRLAAFLNRNRMASVDFVGGRYYAYVDQRYRAELVRFDTLPAAAPGRSAIHVVPPVTRREGDQVFADIASNWLTSSALMSQLLAPRRVPYVHVLQPNQYYSTRRFGDAEAKIAFNPGSPFKNGAARGYPFLERASTAAGAPVMVHDAVHLFDADVRPMYIDDCCHYTRAGYELLADFTSKAVLASRGSWTTPAR
jgi:hypothetical protein